MPAAERPFCSRISASASAVPDDANATLPMRVMEGGGDRLDFGACRGVGRGEGVCAQAAVRKEALRQSHAADLQRLEALGNETAADDEFGGSAADVDDEPRLSGGRQHVRDAVVDEPRFLVAGDDVDREPERALGLRHERRRVGRDAKRVGRDRPHGRRMQSLDALAESREAGEGGAARFRSEAAALVDAPADAQVLAPRVEAEDLVAFDAADFEPEAVRAHVDDGERFRRGERTGHRARERSRNASGSDAFPRLRLSCYARRLPHRPLHQRPLQLPYQLPIRCPSTICRRS